MRTITWILAISLVSVACGDDTTEPDDEPEVATMRLVVGSQTVNVNADNCAVTGGPIALTLNSNATVTATFLLANGSPEPLVTATTFRLDAVPASANVTFTRVSPFVGTLRGTAAGSTTVNFSLFHLEEGHDEFDCDVAVTVQAAVQ